MSVSLLVRCDQGRNFLYRTVGILSLYYRRTHKTLGFFFPLESKPETIAVRFVIALGQGQT